MTNTIRNLVSLKLKAIGSITELLPQVVRGQVKEVENHLIIAVNAATSEYLEHKKNNGNKAEIKKVSIE